MANTWTKRFLKETVEKLSSHQPKSRRSSRRIASSTALLLLLLLLPLHVHVFFQIFRRHRPPVLVNSERPPVLVHSYRTRSDNRTAELIHRLSINHETNVILWSFVRIREGAAVEKGTAFNTWTCTVLLASQTILSHHTDISKINCSTGSYMCFALSH